MLQTFPADDALTFDVEWNEWLFVLVVAFSLTITIGSAFFAWRSRGGARLAWSLSALAGVALLAIAVLGTVDAAPSSPIDLRLKTLLTRVIVALAFVVAGVLGAALALLVLLPRPGKQSLLVAIVPVAVVAAALGLLIVYDDPNTAPDPAANRTHPDGTQLDGEMPTMTSVIGGLELPTGIDIGADGTIAVVQLHRSELRMYRPAGDGYELQTSLDLGIAEEAQAFHVALHPDWPVTPYAYVSLEHVEGGENSLEVLRFRVAEGRPIPGETVIQDLPLPNPVDSNHYGSGITFCDGYFFLSVGDQDHVFTGTQIELAALAQAPLAPEGKVLRYRMEGINLAPDGVIGQDPPVYAMGFRNPFALSCDEATGYPVVSENGDYGHDQVRLAPLGSNHEWPFSDERTLMTPPVFSSGDASIAPTGALYLYSGETATAYLSAWATSTVYAFDLRPDGRMAGPLRAIAFSEGGFFSLALGPDGCLYAGGTADIYRLEYPGCAP